MKRMTFGVLPSKASFHTAWEKHMQDYPDGYPYTLRGREDEASARGARIPMEGTFNEKQLYAIIRKLRNRFYKGDDNAGSIASGILGTLDFEWI